MDSSDQDDETIVLGVIIRRIRKDGSVKETTVSYPFTGKDKLQDAEILYQNILWHLTKGGNER